MPLVAHNDLPTFAELRGQGHDILSAERAARQDIRELHVGFLNMMPDAALQATERQFIRLVGCCNRIAQIFVHPFSLDALNRGATSQRYVERYYSRFDTLREAGLDALIITGANVANPNLRDEPFWQPLLDVVGWAHDNVTSILCSCLATHALLQHFHGINRQPLPAKRWGVYEHRLAMKGHPLLRDVNTRFDAPHSRYNEITQEQLTRAGLSTLVEDESGGVHLAVSPDLFRVVYFQGHPEYDTVSLFKEYKRELLRHRRGELEASPPWPENYFRDEIESLVHRFEQAVLCESEDVVAAERAVAEHLDNTWSDTAKAIVSNWLGLVYQLTNIERRRQFMEGVDPQDPLGVLHLEPTSGEMKNER